ncbi:hypothetical protein CLV90_3187 [Maribacter spongiicola]|uniref:Uncharacterized protein n=1 Tax=Maribacter spongiicola TaxID=1206753 RepID=A0A4R7JV46_9FLAO|nr:hypothetical protein [Maribacter spongiicola]TDT41955.1 hypothetical protein CLV90_3187 [Maribacter spongiicola]
MPFFKIQQFFFYPSQIEFDHSTGFYALNTKNTTFFSNEIVFIKSITDFQKYQSDHYPGKCYIIEMIEDFKSLVSRVLVTWYYTDINTQYPLTITNASYLDQVDTKILSEFNFSNDHEVVSTIRYLNSFFGFKNIAASLLNPIISINEIYDLQTEFSNHEGFYTDFKFEKNEHKKRLENDYFFYFKNIILDNKSKDFLAIQGVQFDTNEDDFKEIPFKKVKWHNRSFGIIDSRSNLL